MNVEKIIDKLTLWLKRQLEVNKKDGFILGVSGGVDSCVMAKLLIDNNINYKLINVQYGDIIPDNDIIILDYLKSVSKSKFINVYLDDIYMNFFEKAIPKGTKYFERLELNTNTKARIREIIFYNYAKIENKLVIGTVNKVEFMIGYFVKNSSIGDLLPFANLSKQQIRSIGAAIGLPEFIVNKKASGCVNKTYAEEEWGFTEKEADLLIQNIINEISPETIERFRMLHLQSEHKRNFPKIFYYDNKN